MYPASFEYVAPALRGSGRCRGAETATVAGVRYYFCCAGCRRRFERDPTPYLAEVSSK